MKIHAIVITGLCLTSPSLLRAGCCEHHDAAEAFQQAHALGEYRIVSVESLAGPSGRLLTRHTASLNQALKGEAPASLVFDTPGGRIGALVEVSSLGLELASGDDCILHLRRNDDDSWSVLPFQSHRNRGTAAEKRAVRDYFRGGARGRMPMVARPAQAGQVGSDQDNAGVPGSVVTPTGYSESSGIPSRFTVCDSGQAIPYLVDIDADKLPPGMTPAAALEAVEQALGAWSATSSLKFRFEGTLPFGAAANSLPSNDGRLRIQLHDSYQAVTTTGVLGIGGGSFTSDPSILRGGTIGGQSFQKRLGAYVILEHNDDFMDDVDNFKVVLTHEIGHALGLAHSSNNPSEPNAILNNATMYYAASNDGRGAAITVYDVDRIQFGYPLNTPPYSIDRVLRAVIANTGNPKAPNTAPTGVGVDRITVSGVDLQGTPLTVSLLPGTDPAMFALNGNTISYIAPANYSDIVNLTPEQIAAGQYYHQALFAFSDGVNQSAPCSLNITGFHRDNYPADGLPNSWLQTYFGVMTAGEAGSPHHPLSDPDKDGLDNRTERYLGTSPVDPKSGPARLTFNPQTRTLTLEAARFAPYSIEASPALTAWNTRTMVSPFNPSASIAIPVPGDVDQSQMFYRARLAP